MSSPFFQSLLLYWRWIIIGLVVVIGVAGIFLLWMPEYARLQQFDQSVLAAKEQERQNLVASAQELQRIQRGFEELDSEKRKRVFALLPRSVSFTYLTTLVQRAAVQAGFSLESFSVQQSGAVKSGEKNVPKEIAVLLQARLAGKGYSQWKSFLAVMERQLPMIDLLSTQFRPENITQDFSFQTYILP